MKQSEPFAPYVPAESNLKEFSLQAVLMGVVLGLVFGVGNAYLGLKVGMTISASIPAAVMSMALLRAFGSKATILEHNMVQTIASSGEGMAAGVIFTIPALFFLGAPPTNTHIFLLALLGGLLGVFLMIPLRHHLMVDEHKTLRFPEGTACAQILKSREFGGNRAFLVISGIICGFIDKALMGIGQLWNESIAWTIHKTYTITLDTTPSLIGVGFIIGVRYAMIMLAGGALGWWVLVPLVDFFGHGGSTIFPGTIPISEMSPETVWSNYIRYIGTGAVAAGGVISLLRLAPLLYRSFHGHFKGMISKSTGEEKERTARDLPFSLVIGGCIVLFAALLLIPELGFNWVAVLLIILLVPFFVGITSITVGLIGNSSNPASGMIICALLFTGLVFLSLGWTDSLYILMAMSVGCIVGIAIALGGDTSQDLKTGMLIGATPKWQQLGAMIGVLVPACLMGYTLNLMQDAYQIGSPSLPAPQATLMSIIVKGTLQQDLPFSLVTSGAILGIVVELMGVAALPFAIGLYLPLGTTVTIACGGVLSWIVLKWAKREEDVQESGVLVGSGLIAGDAFTGVIIALLSVSGLIAIDALPYFGDWLGLVSIGVVTLIYGWLCQKSNLKDDRETL